MRTLSKLIISLALCGVATLAGACERIDNCLFKGELQLGVALGLGFSSNPLEGGDDIPLVILPDVAWYGEAAYFDNGELGYQWIDQVSSSFVTYVTLDKERAYFSFWHPANILAPVNRFNNITSADAPGLNGPEQLSISVDEVSRRRWAVMAGGRWSLQQDNTQWQVALEKDVSGAHNGEKIDLSYQYFWQWPTVRFTTQLKMIWKSSALVDYYYGVDEQDRVDPSFYYDAGSGWQPAIAMSLQKNLQNSWYWLTRVSLQKLHSGMTDSPLVSERNIYSVFSGFAYQF